VKQKTLAIRTTRRKNETMSTLDPGPPPADSTERLTSIDALRGFDMFWIVGGEGLAKAIADCIGGPTKEFVHEQLEHADWEGFRFYDLIFPLFLFLVGVVLPFSLGKIRDRGGADLSVYWRVCRRTALLFCLGLIYYGILKFNPPSEQRYVGVLQRIAIGYFFAALIQLNMGVRGQAITLAAILVGYWALLFLVAPPDSFAGDYSKEHNLPGWVDRHYLPGKIFDAYYGYGDNEGLLSTIPAVATALLGVLAGEWLRSGATPARKILGLMLAGGICLSLGYLWSSDIIPARLQFPIIKNIWTSSFVLWAGGWSLLLLAVFYAIIDVLRFRAWAFFFIVIGMNAITIYMAEAIIPFHHIAGFFLQGLARISAEEFGEPGRDVVPQAGAVALAWLLLFHLYRQKIFLRL
jgi:predicted acyltransferase